MESFNDLKTRLDLNPDHQLMLDTVPMILMPRWFFVAIKNEMERLCGPERTQEVYYLAGWEGARKWVEVQMEQAGLTGRDVLEQYMNSASLRGWGELTVMEFDEMTGHAVVRLRRSAIAEETGPSDRVVCDHLPGSIAGAVQAILKASGRQSNIRGRERKCISRGDETCEFVTEPAA